ncbi:MAG: hypothetical protein ABSC55_21010 [Syntrophorhabdales bacterium]|jgi:hypothetical protein
MKLRDVISELKNHQDRLTPDEQETLGEIFARLFELSGDVERVPADQRELVDDLLRDMDDLAYAAYGLAAALESR